MDILLKKAKINKIKIRAEVTKIVAYNLNSLVEPCFYPNIKKYYYEFLDNSGLTDTDAKEFTKRRWKGRKEYKFHIHMDVLNNFYIFLMQYFLKQKDMVTYRYLMLFYTLRQYTNELYNNLPYCIPETFKYALDNLTRNHLFVREKTIGNALYYLSNESIRRWTNVLETNDLDGISRFMTESRSRINQSLRSFREEYFRVAEEGGGIKTEVSTTDDEENSYQSDSGEKTIRIIDDVVRKITVYKSVDIKSQEEARNLTKINSSIATVIINKLGNTKYIDIIRIILKLFIRDLTSVKKLCGKEYYDFVRQLMTIKRTKQKIYFKQQINILLLELLKDSRYTGTYNKLTVQTQFLVNLFLAYYITLQMRTSSC